MATSRCADRRARRAHLVLLYALGANIWEKPDGIAISAMLIAGIIVVFASGVRPECHFEWAWSSVVHLLRYLIFGEGRHRPGRAGDHPPERAWHG